MDSAVRSLFVGDDTVSEAPSDHRPVGDGN